MEQWLNKVKYNAHGGSMADFYGDCWGKVCLLMGFCEGGGSADDGE